MQAPEDRDFERFQRTGTPEALAAAFDAVAPELWRVGWYLSGGDRHRAEDALQATFLTAIEDRLAWDSSRPLRPWLLGILNNHVRKERRRDQRTPPGVDVSSVLGVDGAESSGDPAAEAEVRQLVATAVRQLGAPYREVMVLHLEHGLTAQEIADATDRKPATVRTQIVRGLDLLRRALPAGLAGSGAVLAMPSAGAAADAVARVRAATLTHAAHVVPVASATAWGLTVLTKTHLMIAILLSLSSLIAYAVWSGPVLDRAAVPPAAEATGAAEEELGAGDAERAAVAGDPGRRPAAIAEKAPQTYTLRLIVRDPDGKPLPRAWLMARLPGGTRYFHADATGRATLEDIPVGSFYAFSLVGNRGSIAGALRGARPWVRDLELRAEAGIDLKVRVVDATGAPSAGALVEGVLGAQWERMYNPLGRTDSQGELVLRHATETGQLRAYAPGHRLSRLLNFSAEKGSTKEVTLRLGSPGVTARGRVVDERGQPMPGVELAVVQFGDRATSQYFRADAKGEFTMDWLEATRHLVLGRRVVEGVTRIGYVRIDLSSGSAPETELVLRPGVELTGMVSNEAGDPLVQVQVGVQLQIDGVFDVPFTQRTTRTLAGGAYVLSGLPAGTYRGRAGDDVEKRGRIELRAGQQNTWNPVIPVSRRVQVRVVDDQDRPLQGWRVQLRDPGTGFASGSSPLTDEDGLAGQGRWADWKLAPGEVREVVLQAPIPEGVEALRGGTVDEFPTFVAPPVGASDQPHTIRVPARCRVNASLRGRVLDGEGRPAGKVEILLSSARQKYHQMRFWTGAEDGRFVIRPLSPGRYSLRIRLPSGASFVENVHVTTAGELDLGDLRRPQTAPVRVVLRAADGGVMPRTPGLRVRVQARDGRSYVARRQADGAFSAPRIVFGPATVLVWSSAHPTARQEIRVAGAVEVQVRMLAPVAPTRMRIRLPKDQERHQQSWSGTVTVTDAKTGALVRSLRVAHPFRGQFTATIETGAALAPGAYRIDLKSWDGLRTSSEVQVPSAGGVDLVLPEHGGR